MRILGAWITTLVLGGVLLAVGASGAGAAPGPSTPAASAGCAGGQIHVSTGCVSRAVARKHIAAMIRRQMPELGLRAAIVRVDPGEKPLISEGFGNSMKGVPASPRMYWRIGSIAIPYLIDILLQLEDEGKLSLNDKLAKYRPNFPEADEITLRMLANVTSGYPDIIQENPAFQKLLLENPFRQFSASELIHWAFTLPIPCKPGTCFHYAHTNFAILSQVISKVTGKSVSALMQERVLGPLGLRHTAVSRYPAFPGPALHAYTGERGLYEDATFWSPSWSIGAGTAMSSTLGDAVRGFRAMAGGALISAKANRERAAPLTAHLKPFTTSLYYGLGVTGANGWQFQNPFIDGYTRMAAYLPFQDPLARRRHDAAAAELGQRGQLRDRHLRRPDRLSEPRPPGRNPRNAGLVNLRSASVNLAADGGLVASNRVCYAGELERCHTVEAESGELRSDEEKTLRENAESNIEVAESFKDFNSDLPLWVRTFGGFRSRLGRAGRATLNGALARLTSAHVAHEHEFFDLKDPAADGVSAALRALLAE